MPNSFLRPEGLFNPTLRFAFTNITDKEFVSFWDKVPIKVQPNETIELSMTTPIPGVTGQALAVKMTGELVDKLIIEKAKAEEVANGEAFYKSPTGITLGVPTARKEYEDKILRELDVDEESPAMQSMRNQMKKEILGTDEKQPAQAMEMPNTVEEFGDLTADRSIKVEKKEAKVKSIKIDETINAKPNKKEQGNGELQGTTKDKGNESTSAKV